MIAVMERIGPLKSLATGLLLIGAVMALLCEVV